MSVLNLTREADLAAEWELPIVQFRLLRRRHSWPHVEFSRQDIRYTEAHIEHIVRQMTVIGRPVKADDSGLTDRSARRSA